jgi:putative nucleotidyltransferase with HDIG domain
VLPGGAQVRSASRAAAMDRGGAAGYLHRGGKKRGGAPMLDPSAVTDELRARVRTELPEVEEIRDPALRAKVVEAWALALASSSFEAIAAIEPSGNPGVNTLKRGSQTDHIRGVTRLALGIADGMNALLPDLKVDRDIVIAGALCHDVGKCWEFDPKNRARWERDPHAAGLPSVRHPAFGVHVCFTVGLPEEVAHCAAAHSGEGELLVRSLENTIVHHADYAFWAVCRAGDLLIPETIAELKVRH